MDINSYCIIAPCYNEEEVISLFLEDLEAELGVLKNAKFSVVIIDDASIDKSLKKLKNFKFSDKRFSLSVVSLEQNLGHQGAICTGLKHISGLDEAFTAIIVMDSDGEDDPKVLKKILDQHEDITFISRAGRQEGLFFKTGYFIYKILFFLIIGKRINYGNFSVISNKVLVSIANQTFLHYPTFLSKQRFKIEYVPYNRRKRLDGSSKMNTRSLIFHGLYSLIELGEEMLFFFIKILVLFCAMTIGSGVYIILSKFVFNTAIEGWASSFGVGLVIICLVIMSTIVLGLMLVSMKKLFRSSEVRYKVYESTI